MGIASAAQPPHGQQNAPGLLLRRACMHYTPRKLHADMSKNVRSCLRGTGQRSHEMYKPIVEMETTALKAAVE